MPDKKLRSIGSKPEEAVNFPRLFELGSIGSLKVRNRVVMPAMATNLAADTGAVTDDLLAYYAARAQGRVGLIIVENSNVDYPQGKAGPIQLRIDEDTFIPGLHRLVEAVQFYGARVAIQINHSGGVGNPKFTGGLWPVAPSPVEYSAARRVPQELTAVEIEGLIEKFGDAAGRARQAGFDGVEIHGGHGYLLSQFISPSMNLRKDAYGGDLAHRLRFPLEVVRNVRRKVGKDFPIIFRISADEFTTSGHTLEESKRACKMLVQAGVDAIHVSAGTHRFIDRSYCALREPISYPQGWKVYMAHAVKQTVPVPVIAVGVIREPAFAEQVIAEGKADFVAVGRGLMADPEWAAKAEKGGEKTIRKCISCGDCFVHRAVKYWPIRCAINVTTGRERQFSDVPKAKEARRVLVIGGGPSGLEAARIARLRGCQVLLCEEAQELGGQTCLGSAVSFKAKLRWLADYFKQELERLGVEIRTGTKVDRVLVREISPDILIFAGGSIPLIPNIPGINWNPVMAREVLRGIPLPEVGSVLIIGGGTVGCETAVYLAEKGCSVTIIEMRSEVALDEEPLNRFDLLERLKGLGVRVMTGTSALEIEKTGLVVLNNAGQRERMTADLVVLATGAQPSHESNTAFQDLAPQVWVTGDAARPGRIIDAIWDGFRVASQI